MLVTLSSEGASLARLELSSERYRDLEDRSGYLGHLVMDNSDKGPGCLVQVVGAGTPAASGRRAARRSHSGTGVPRADDHDRRSARAWNRPSAKTKPGETVELVIQRGKDRLPNAEGKADSPAAGSDSPRAEKAEHGLDFRRHASTRSPWDDNCPPSLLTTLQQVDGDKLRADEDPDAKMEEELTQQLPGVELRRVNWKIDSQESDKDQPGGPITKVVFSCLVPQVSTQAHQDVRVGEGRRRPRDRRRCQSLPPAADPASDQSRFEAARSGLSPGRTQRVAGRRGLVCHEGAEDGHGPPRRRLPIESPKISRWWPVRNSRRSRTKARRSARTWSRARSLPTTIFPCFSASMPSIFRPPCCPTKSTAAAIDRAVAFRVGEIETQRKTLTNTTFRLIGKPATIGPGESSPAKLRAVCRPEAAHALGDSTKCRVWSTMAGRFSIGLPCP